MMCLFFFYFASSSTLHHGIHHHDRHHDHHHDHHHGGIRGVPHRNGHEQHDVIVILARLNESLHGSPSCQPPVNITTTKRKSINAVGYVCINV